MLAARLSSDVATVLAAEIRDLPAGHRLAGEHAIMRRFGVSRSTVRAALQELHDQYLVRRVRGSGTYVHRRIDHVISPSRQSSFHEAIAGASAYTQLVEADLRPVPDRVAERLRLPAGAEAQRLVRLSYLDDEVVGCSQDWVGLEVGEHLDVGLRVIESLDLVLRGRGFTPVRAWSQVGLDPPPPEIGERLDPAGARPTWRVESLTRNQADSRPLSCGTDWIRPDLVRLVVELDE